MQSSDDVHLLHIVQSGNGVLVAEQVPGNTYFPAATISVLCVVVMLYLAWKRRWVFLAIPLLVVAIAFLVRISGTTYRMSVDEHQGRISWQGFRRGRSVLSGNASFRDLATADVASGKAGGRLVLVHRDGSQDLPLGDTYTVNEPVQFLLAEKIRRLIGTNGHP